MEIWLVNSRCACQVEFNTVKCPFLFIPTFQLKCSRRSHARPDDSIYQHFLFRIYIPSGMNTFNYYPADNCGSCKAFPDFPESPQMLSGCTLCFNSAAFDVFSCPSPGPPVGVGMNIDIASIDMVSEVNMVSGSLSPLFFYNSWANDKCTVCTCQGKYPSPPLGKPFSMLLCFFFSLFFPIAHTLTDLWIQRESSFLFKAKLSWPLKGVWCYSHVMKALFWVSRSDYRVKSIALSTIKLIEQSKHRSKTDRNTFSYRPPPPQCFQVRLIYM